MCTEHMPSNMGEETLLTKHLLPLCPYPLMLCDSEKSSRSCWRFCSRLVRVQRIWSPPLEYYSFFWQCNVGRLAEIITLEEKEEEEEEDREPKGGTAKLSSSSSPSYSVLLLIIFSSLFLLSSFSFSSIYIAFKHG